MGIIRKIDWDIENALSRMGVFEEMLLRAWEGGYPRMGEIKRYKIVPVTEEDIAKEKAEEIEKAIEREELKLKALKQELGEVQRKLK